MKVSSLFVLLVFLLVNTSCEKIFEEDIEGKAVTVLAPADSIVLPQANITFWWEKFENVEQYRIQIVSESFDQISLVLVDSLVTGDKLVFPMQTGMYQWRVRGENTAYKSNYVTRTLIVDSTGSLANLAVILTNPLNGAILNDSIITFQWQALQIADDYRFDLSNSNFSGTALYSDNITNNNITLILDEGTYQWRVRAQDANNNSNYSTSSFTIDIAAPSPPNLLQPVNEAFIQTDSMIFSWASAANAVFDTIYIYNDSTYLNVAQKIGSSTQTAHILTPITGTYYWRVRSFSQGGNASSYSLGRRFITQP